MTSISEMLLESDGNLETVKQLFDQVSQADLKVQKKDSNKTHKQNKTYKQNNELIGISWNRSEKQSRGDCQIFD
jgi:hypothetical protein